MPRRGGKPTMNVKAPPGFKAGKGPKGSEKIGTARGELIKTAKRSPGGASNPSTSSPSTGRVVEEVRSRPVSQPASPSPSPTREEPTAAAQRPTETAPPPKQGKPPGGSSAGSGGGFARGMIGPGVGDSVVEQLKLRVGGADASDDAIRSFAHGGLGRGTPEPLKSMAKVTPDPDDVVGLIQTIGDYSRELRDDPVAFALKHGIPWP